MGPPAFGGRYVRQLAIRSALRKKQVFAWSAALPHCLPSVTPVGRRTAAFSLVVASRFAPLDHKNQA